MKVLMLDIPYKTKMVFPAELSAVAASLLAQATLVKTDHYGSNLSPAGKDEKISMEFVDSSVISVVTDREKELMKSLEDQRSSWITQYNENNANKKLVDQLRAEIEGIRSVTTCTVAEPETPVADDDNGDF